ncbi:uncharacterized protein BDR25DRAFT_311456 [Lindgomyces ingoldianus]|uniref:Uncharacterized protein n=1 Tax=Lindgomyces ingoldianus TaxID=673940 RepID=A0ACB6R4D6_9PLEO|nr:uncharacterized protein BDR25DRAFT_311456 [Lindgomyces ingoldianus]KAF2474046.1 hypothetical protein BDR25DRAFT_311456 [Lindgomyces ingoldianus]
MGAKATGEGRRGRREEELVGSRSGEGGDEGDKRQNLERQTGRGGERLPAKPSRQTQGRRKGALPNHCLVSTRRRPVLDRSRHSHRLLPRACRRATPAAVLSKPNVSALCFLLRDSSNCFFRRAHHRRSRGDVLVNNASECVNMLSINASKNPPKRLRQQRS